MDEQDGQDEELTLPEHAKNAKKSGLAGTGINGGGTNVPPPSPVGTTA